MRLLVVLLSKHNVHWAAHRNTHVPLYPPGGGAAQQEGVGLCELLEPDGAADRISHCYVGQAPVGSKAPPYHGAGMRSQAHHHCFPTYHTMGRILRAQALLELQGCLHRPLRMILTRDRYAKECHEAVVKEGLHTATTVLH